MRPSKKTIILYSSILITVGIITSKFLFFMDSINADVDQSQKNVSSSYKFITDSSENIVWMIQVSDLHISNFHDWTRITELIEFCNKTLDIIKPTVVLATGDLTDAKTPDGEGSEQYEAEWRIYKNVLYESGVPNKTLWLDIRGNHDNFNVLNINAPNNYFRKYSIQGPNHPRSYLYITRMKNSEKIGFLGIDSCLEVGIRRPFNFVGQLTSEEIGSIRSLVRKTQNEDVDYLFWFGHYPTSTIQYPESEQLRKLIANDSRSIGYFCGHLHQIGGLVPDMYAFQKEGYFELELGDWRGNRIIRLMAIDHGQFSFIDVKHNTWPIVLVTNPKTVLLVPPYKIQFIPISSHIRLLVFSSSRIKSVRLKIDENEWQICKTVGGPLYVAKWNQKKYEKGLHVITIEVEDENRSTIREHQFSLDGTRIKTRFLPRLFLMPNLGVLFYCLFTSSIVFCSLPLFVCRYLMKSNKVDTTSLANIKCRFFRRWIRRLCILTSLNYFFYPLVFYPIYLFAGPWTIVYLVEKKLGVIFSWGLIVDYKFVPSWITYPFGWIQIILHTFLILHLGRHIDRRCYNVSLRVESSSRFLTRKFVVDLWDNSFYVFLILIQTWDTYNFWLSYGHLALIFCPLKTWWIIMALWLKKRIQSLSKERCRMLAEFGK